jgi:glyoxylase-like metal-dependent hydrolase (beta-lactamase superfamily II)
VSKWQYTLGLHDLGTGCYAYLQPNGSWGYSNAGLIADSGETLLVDTLFDLGRTRDMLARMRAAVPAAKAIGTLVNTHSNGDHTYGNQLVEGAQIIASRACAEEMREQGPPLAPGSIRRDWQRMGVAGAFFQEVMGSVFSAEGIELTIPSRTFDGELELRVGQKLVRLIEVGPAHTRGDVIVHVPADRTVFTGDILFNEGHPVVWAGPVSNWIRACDRMLGWDIETVVPGHGPITDRSGIRALKHYLEYVRDEARKRHQAGLSFEQAARDIALDQFKDWLDPERIVVNVFACYREFNAHTAEPNIIELRAAMGRLYFERKSRSQEARSST